MLLYAGFTSGHWAVVHTKVRIDEPFRLPQYSKEQDSFNYKALEMAVPYGKLHINLQYRLPHRIWYAEVTWRRPCGQQNPGLPDSSWDPVNFNSNLTAILTTHSRLRASVADPGGSCRQVCFLNLLLLKLPNAFTQCLERFLNMPFPGMDRSWSWKSDYFLVEEAESYEILQIQWLSLPAITADWQRFASGCCIICKYMNCEPEA